MEEYIFLPEISEIILSFISYSSNNFFFVCKSSRKLLKNNLLNEKILYSILKSVASKNMKESSFLFKLLNDISSCFPKNKSEYFESLNKMKIEYLPTKKYQNLNLAKYFFKKFKFDIHHSKNKFIELACRYTHCDLVDFFFENDYFIQTNHKYSFTPKIYESMICKAVERKNLKIVKTLFEKVDKIKKVKNTDIARKCFDIALEKNYLEIVEYIFPFVSKNNFKIPALATSTKRNKIFEFLFENVKPQNTYHLSLAAIKNKNFETFEYILGNTTEKVHKDYLIEAFDCKLFKIFSHAADKIEENTDEILSYMLKSLYFKNHSAKMNCILTFMDHKKINLNIKKKNSQKNAILDMLCHSIQKKINREFNFTYEQILKKVINFPEVDIRYEYELMYYATKYLSFSFIEFLIQKYNDLEKTNKSISLEYECDNSPELEQYYKNFLTLTEDVSLESKYFFDYINKLKLNAASSALLYSILNDKINIVKELLKRNDIEPVFFDENFIGNNLTDKNAELFELLFKDTRFIKMIQHTNICFKLVEVNSLSMIQSLAANKLLPEPLLHHLILDITKKNKKDKKITPILEYLKSYIKNKWERDVITTSTHVIINERYYAI